MDIPERAHVGLPGSRADITVPADETSLLSEGDAFLADVHESPNGQFSLYLAEGHGDATEVEEDEEVPHVDHGMFVFRGETFLCEYAAQRPRLGDIANDGTTVVVDTPRDQSGDSNRGNTVYSFTKTGKSHLTFDFEENVMNVAISPEGSYIACTTPPSDDNTIYVLNVDEGSLKSWHEADCDTIFDIEFDQDSEDLINIFDHPDQPMVYSIDVEGKIAEQSDPDAERLNLNLNQLIETVSKGTESDYELLLAWDDLQDAVSMAPDAFEIETHVDPIIGAIEKGKAPDTREDENLWSLAGGNVLTELAQEAPVKILPYADRIVNLLMHEDEMAKIVGGRTLNELFISTHTELKSDKMDPYVSDIRNLMESSDEQTRKWASMAYKGVTRAERYGHDYSDTVEEDELSGVEIQIERLRTADTVDDLSDACSTLMTAFREDEDLASENSDLIPRLLSILDDHEPDLEYSDGEDDAYDYRDDLHAKQYGCTKSAMRTLTELAPHDPQAFEGTLGRFIRYCKSTGDINTNVRGAASSLLVSLATADSEWFCAELQAHEEDFFSVIEDPAGGRVFARSLTICRHYAEEHPGRLEPVLPVLIRAIATDNAFTALQSVAGAVPNVLAAEENLLTQCLGSEERSIQERATKLLESLATANYLSDDGILAVVDELSSDSPDSVHRSLLEVIAAAVDSGHSLPNSVWKWLTANTDHDDWQIRAAIAGIASSSNRQESETILEELREDPIPEVQAATNR